MNAKRIANVRFALFAKGYQDEKAEGAKGEKMFKAEKRVVEFIEKHVTVLFCLAVLVTGCLLRIVGFHYLSDDMRLYLLKWYGRIAEEGISQQIGNYNIPYQIIIWILTKFPLNPIHAYKVVSCAFDLGLALLCGGLTYWFARGRKEIKAVLAFACVFCSPIVLLNSAVWGQCDSIYTFFGILAFVLLYKEKYALSMLAFGAAFAFKLQAVFFLPFFLICYLCRKKFSIVQFLIVPATAVFLSLPGLLAGRNVMELIDIYKKQTNTYNRVYVNFPNIYTLITTEKGHGDYEMFRKAAILLTILMLGIGVYICVKKGAELWNFKIFFAVAMWTLYTCSFFLPNMHERYAYVLEVMAIFYAFLEPAGIVLAIGTNLVSIFTYGNYLFEYRAISLPISSLISLILYSGFTYWLFARQMKGGADARGDANENGLKKAGS